MSISELWEVIRWACLVWFVLSLFSAGLVLSAVMSNRPRGEKLKPRSYRAASMDEFMGLTDDEIVRPRGEIQDD